MFEKQHFSLDNAIGCPLGSVFEVKGSKLCSLEVDEDVDDLLIATDNTGERIYKLIFFILLSNKL